MSVKNGADVGKLIGSAVDALNTALKVASVNSVRVDVATINMVDSINPLVVVHLQKCDDKRK